MKKFIIAVLCIISCNAFCQTNQFKLDQTKPESVVNAIFYAAQTEDYSILENLCDPTGEGDGDTKSLCSVYYAELQVKSYGGSLETKELIKSFKEAFSCGRICGKTTYETNENVEYATVPILFNGDGSGKTQEKMELVKRDGLWYLSSF